MSDTTMGLILMALAAIFGVWLVVAGLIVFAVYCLWYNVFRNGRK